METYRRQAEAVVGRRIVGVDAPDEWYVKNGVPAELGPALVGQVVVAARRIGKLLVLDLDDGTRLGLRFGMTGRLLVDGAASIEKLEYSSARDEPAWTRFTLHFDDGGDLRMRDPRRLGGVELEPEESRLGPDAATLTVEQLRGALGRSNAPIKARLLDQARVAGIGNLLADDLLWRAGIDPVRPASSLTDDEVATLRDAVVTTFRELGERGGSHMGEMRAAAALDGLCPLDGTPLLRRTVGGRTTWSCPKHQR